MKGENLGAVTASVLDYDNLIKLTGDPEVIDPTKSQWVPADGRSIRGSTLSKLTGIADAPDLRGRFIRGLNTIYNIGQPEFDIDKGDQDGANRKVGDYQADNYKSHSHSASGHITGNITGSNGSRDCDGGNDKCNSDPSFPDRKVDVTVMPSGGSETRPRNVAMYYYIKIN